MRLFDTLKGLVNELSGLGGIRDKGAAGTWVFAPMTAMEAESAYRSNWMARKAVDIPAWDSFRAGWAWQGIDTAQITALEKAQKYHDITNKAMQAMCLGRLFGGGALYLSDGNPNPAEPLNVSGKGDLKFIRVLSRYELSSTDLNQDPTSENYLEPVMYQVQTPTAGSIDVDPSRIIRFLGNPIPRSYLQTTDMWSDSVLDAIEIAIRDATAGQAGIAAMIQEAKLDVIKIDGFMKNISNAAYRTKVLERNQLSAMMKSMTNALIIDKNDDFEQKSLSFQSLPDILKLLLMIVSGACDIPATRFLSQSPQGMNATGDGDLRNYYDRISADQELRLRQPLARALDLIAISEFGSLPNDLWFEFNPLWEMSTKELADISKTNADTAKSIMDSGLIPREIMSKTLTTQMTESGNWPGIEDALKEYGTIDFEELDEAEPTGEDAFGDAAPMSLYVSRKVLNAQEIIDWAKSQGFKTTVPADDLHVTVMYSRTAVDWMKAPQDYWNEEGTMLIPPGGPRVVSEFDGGAIVLEFAAAQLGWRWWTLKEIGAEPTHDTYNPHITITWERGEVDLDAIEPYTGKIKLGPEIFKKVNEGWKLELQEV